MDTIPLSIVIITLNESSNIGHILDDLCAQSLTNFEVVVCDSNSDDDTVAIAEAYADRLDLRTVVMQQRGTSLGRNTGAAHARHERLLFLDADVRLRADFIAQLHAVLNKRRLLVGAGRMTSSDTRWLNRLGIRLFDLGMWLTQWHFPTCTGACIVSSKTVHEFIGGFDERITLCEDCDYVKRASQTFRFRMLPVFFEFHPRRLDQDGIFRLGWTYFKANVMRFFRGELTENEIHYPFAHYQQDDKSNEQKSRQTP
ncbi:glycosyltransferase [Suttonella sp. R2A3]|uniref:glycosyltransferase n=1 Tax=Suttonella sp. R2A3 TaxID=2908648 RepID=UPI001F1865B5|nr:glycosyltransferase [Suttonella sp. R2A3]UJF23783.1 glycosyltransferase [Suttonella sp. R2A3]